MNRLVVLEEDVFRYVIQHARDFEDTPSQILRRLLRIERPGSRVRRVAGSSYWALTNIPTREKQRILRGVMTMLGFGEDAMLGAREYLARGRLPTLAAAAG